MARRPTPFQIPLVVGELQLLLEPPLTILPYHLVLEATRELPTKEQRQLIQSLKE